MVLLESKQRRETVAALAVTVSGRRDGDGESDAQRPRLAGRCVRPTEGGGNQAGGAVSPRDRSTGRKQVRSRAVRGRRTFCGADRRIAFCVRHPTAARLGNAVRLGRERRRAVLECAAVVGDHRRDIARQEACERGRDAAGRRDQKYHREPAPASASSHLPSISLSVWDCATRWDAQRLSRVERRPDHSQRSALAPIAATAPASCSQPHSACATRAFPATFK